MMKIQAIRPIVFGRKPKAENQLVAERDECAPGAVLDLDDATALDLIRKGAAISLEELPMSEIDRMFRDSFATNVGDLDVVNLKRRHVLATATMGHMGPEYTYTKG